MKNDISIDINTKTPLENNRGDSYSITKENNDKLNNIKHSLISSLKELVYKLVSKDFDFFADYKKYTEAVGYLHKLNFGLSELPISEDEFIKNPPAAFVDLFTIIVSIIDCLPINKTLSKDKIIAKSNDNSSGDYTEGVYVSIPLDIAELDFKTVVLSLFIPSELSQIKALVCIDNTPVLHG